MIKQFAFHFFNPLIENHEMNLPDISLQITRFRETYTISDTKIELAGLHLVRFGPYSAASAP